jgi:periplasmic protein TonB
MAYATEEKGKKAAGMGMAIAVNGSIIASIMLSPMIVKPREKLPDTTVVNVPNKPTIIPDPKVDPKLDQQKTAIEPIFTPKNPFNPPQKDNEVTITEEETGTPVGTGGTTTVGKGGDEVTIGEDVSVIPKPVFVRSKRDPAYASRFQPDYPSGLLVKEIEGDAVIKILIGADGRVREAMVVSASHPDFGKAAVKQALKSWRFIPATRDGQPVEDWQTIPVRFTINS